MNQLASILIVMTLTISISQCVVCHDESANVNNTGRLTNERPLIRPVFDQRNTYSPKDRFDNDKIIFDLPSHEATTVPAEIKDRYGNGSGSGSENGIGNGFGSKANDPDQQYYSKANGEYQFSLKIRNGIRHVESGEYEERNGQPVFIIRGFFEHITKDGTLKINAYIFDHTGYHEVTVPVITDSSSVSDFRPSQEEECDISKGEYCIDRKLLTLMVG